MWCFILKYFLLNFWVNKNFFVKIFLKLYKILFRPFMNLNKKSNIKTEYFVILVIEFKILAPIFYPLFNACIIYNLFIFNFPLLSISLSRTERFLCPWLCFFLQKRPYLFFKQKQYRKKQKSLSNFSSYYIKKQNT